MSKAVEPQKHLTLDERKTSYLDQNLHFLKFYLK